MCCGCSTWSARTASLRAAALSLSQRVEDLVKPSGDADVTVMTNCSFATNLCQPKLSQLFDGVSSTKSRYNLKDKTSQTRGEDTPSRKIRRRHSNVENVLACKQSKNALSAFQGTGDPNQNQIGFHGEFRVYGMLLSSQQPCFLMLSCETLRKCSLNFFVHVLTTAVRESQIQTSPKDDFVFSC